MAIMIPEKVDWSITPPSEQVVFDALQKYLSDEWHVFHSYSYLHRDRNDHIWDGEADFLLYHPQKGVLVMEVKGGAISYNGGTWYQDGRRIDPVTQARSEKYAVISLLQEILQQQIPMKFAHCVCFPSIGARDWWPAEAQDIVVTKDNLRFIEQFADELLARTRLPDCIMSTVTPGEILRVLNPDFDCPCKLSGRLGVEKLQFARLSESQSMILGALAEFKRLQFKGCAGSGKTFMAVKKAIMLAEEGANVLLLCFNQMLADRLKREVKLYPAIHADAFFEFCIDLMNIPEDQVGQHRGNPRLYTEVLPKLLEQYLYENCVCYDAIIVDEGQDFTPEAWNVIPKLLVDDGVFYIFYDPDQNIFTDEVSLPDFGRPPVCLTRNCRNTRNIFNALKPYQTLPSECPEYVPTGSEVRVLQGDCHALLEQELERLVSEEQIAVQNIVILTGHGFEHTGLGSAPDVGRFHIVNRKCAPDSKNEVACYTYMKFKGCESNVVILYEVDDNDWRWSRRQGIYTAMSRAIHQLIVLKKG